MNLEVITVPMEEYEAAIPCPPEGATMEHYKSYVKENLAAARDKGLDPVCFRSLPPSEKPSDNFNRIMWIEQAIKEFQDQYDDPKTVRIVCDSDKNAEPYKVIYNFYYAVTKSDRLEDDNWD